MGPGHRPLLSVFREAREGALVRAIEDTNPEAHSLGPLDSRLGHFRRALHLDDAEGRGGEGD